jgi:CheY-like chemotaxis protein
VFKVFFALPSLEITICVDAETAALSVRKRVLDTAGHDAITTRSGEEDIQLFRSQPLDLVLVDYWIPGMNGIVTAREIRRIKPPVPMTILSGFAQLPDETIGVVDRWILKDEGPEFPLSTIRALLKLAC